MGSENYPRESVCFHCQQYVEKLLKAFLTLHDIEAPRTHDLRRLIQLSSPQYAEIGEYADRVDSLTACVISSRYPGDWLQIEDGQMQELVKLAKELADLLLPKLQV